MKSFTQYLTESRSAPLYHGTSVDNATDILRYNMIESRTAHPLEAIGRKFGAKGSNSFGEMAGVSLTRSFNIAKNFGVTIFELDQLKLSHKYKIIPMQYFSYAIGMKGARTSDMQSKSGASTEAEEFILGSIKNLDQYVTKIWTRKQDLAVIERFVDPSKIEIYANPWGGAW